MAVVVLGVVVFAWMILTLVEVQRAGGSGLTEGVLAAGTLLGCGGVTWGAYMAVNVMKQAREAKFMQVAPACIRAVAQSPPCPPARSV